MSVGRKPYIVLIDDDVSDETPLIDYLRTAYGEQKVLLFKEPDAGVKFIEENLSERIIVLLDIMFNDKPLGFELFERILEKSALVCCIIMTGTLGSNSLAANDLVRLINGHAWYIIKRDAPIAKIKSVIKDAEAHLSLRVDGALEEWVLRQPLENQQKPFLKSSDGKVYTLLDILRAVRTGDDEIGARLTKSILSTAIEILSRDKSRIGN